MRVEEQAAGQKVCVHMCACVGRYTHTHECMQYPTPQPQYLVHATMTKGQSWAAEFGKKEAFPVYFIQQSQQQIKAATVLHALPPQRPAPTQGPSRAETVSSEWVALGAPVRIWDLAAGTGGGERGGCPLLAR